MDYYFRIAQQTVRFRASEKWLVQLPNYAPFRTLRATAKPLFSLSSKRLREGQYYQPQNWKELLIDKNEPDMPRIEIYRNEKKQWLIRVAPTADAPICAETLCEKDFKHAQLFIAPECEDIRFCFDNAAMLLYAFTTAKLRTLEMHAAAVVHQGKAVLFLGHSGTGKSTHARQWLAQYHDAWLLNDDNPILRIENNGQLYVYGSPWSGKAPCYRNTMMPVAAIVQLQQASQNRLEKMSNAEAYAHMLSSCSGLKIEKKMMDGLHPTISDVVLRTPMYKLECLPDKQAAQLCHTLLDANTQ